jgi:hypothetical protein
MRKTLGCLVLLVFVTTLGCARAARDTTGFATTDSAVVNAPLEKTWTATRDVLNEHKLDVYTRDKRGRFVAYSDMHRQLLLVPHRQEYTITLQEQGGATNVTIQTLKQVYGVTLLTYPDWHARKTTNNSEAQALLNDIQARATGQEPAPAPAEAPKEGTGNKG